ncbi:SDR family NAD(P)-dependent oxidoreductase [Pedobacter sp. MC2016-24]|uniref:SDR family NAD(P)-dependent oxidoreductase n=1 Tax=Pedobacter sp. MC2016-24 TaxID=2780090 RepID=UPI001882F268|nr:SDR family oxidoreductase [Pedobacter sp. MC2016-24]MBE9601377.1 SDR family oxidoreductase [Pedobacter sp. MC2016-24]
MDRKKVIVLGGSSGIGKAIAERFATAGALVIIASSDLSKAEQVKDSLPGSGHAAFLVDVRSGAQLKTFRKIIINQFAGFDILINSIGVSGSFPVLNSRFTDWDNLLQVMLYGTVNACRMLLPLMADGGRIIHITSIHHQRVEKGSSAYGMAKAAITQFTRSLALELAPRHILANTIAPGFVDTPMSVDHNGINELETDWFKDNYVKYDHLPLKRAAKPEEIAGVAYFLAGPDATYITGSVITVDGGLTITF